MTPSIVPPTDPKPTRRPAHGWPVMGRITGPGRDRLDVLDIWDLGPDWDYAVAGLYKSLPGAES